jgi:hypothetical protein
MTATATEECLPETAAANGFVATFIELYLYACESVLLQQLHQKITGILPMLGRSVIFLTVGRIAWAERNSRRTHRNLSKAGAKID